MKALLAYQQVRSLIKTGDMLEWRSKSVIGSMIRFFSKEKVNHTSLCIHLKEYKDMTDPHKFILEAEPNGIELNLISRQLEQYSGSVWWSPLKPEYDDRRDAIAQWALEKVGVKYDYKSLFSNIFGHVSADAKKFFCSEYYYLALNNAGILPDGKAPRPGEFEKFKVHLPAIQIL